MEMSPQVVSGFMTAKTERNMSVSGSCILTLLVQAVKRHAESLPENEILFINSFLHLGKPDEIRQAISILIEQEDFFKVEKDCYVLSKEFYNMKYCPSIESVIQNIAELNDEVITETGGSAANVFHLSPDMPMQRMYWTSGDERELEIGGIIIKLQHTEKWKLVYPFTKEGDAFRAILIKGKGRAKQSLAQIKPLFNENEQQKFDVLQSCVKSWLGNEFSDPVNDIDNIELAM